MATVTDVMGTGFVGISWSAAAAIASTASIPDVTDPMIWYVFADGSGSRASSVRTMKN